LFLIRLDTLHRIVADDIPEDSLLLAIPVCFFLWSFWVMAGPSPSSLPAGFRHRELTREEREEYREWVLALEAKQGQLSARSGE
jgi:hypothetical protein